MTNTPESIVRAILAGDVDAATLHALVDAIKDAEAGDAVLALSQLLAALLLAQARAAQTPQVVPVPMPEVPPEPNPHAPWYEQPWTPWRRTPPVRWDDITITWGEPSSVSFAYKPGLTLPSRPVESVSSVSCSVTNTNPALGMYGGKFM